MAAVLPKGLSAPVWVTQGLQLVWSSCMFPEAVASGILVCALDLGVSQL